MNSWSPANVYSIVTEIWCQVVPEFDIITNVLNDFQLMKLR